MRASKTLEKTYVGILYERAVSSSDDSVMIQGLIGRMCGYDDNGTSIIYTNIKGIINYNKLIESKFMNFEQGI